jgi:hypothetical protein
MAAIVRLAVMTPAMATQKPLMRKTDMTTR